MKQIVMELKQKHWEQFCSFWIDPLNRQRPVLDIHDGEANKNPSKAFWIEIATQSKATMTTWWFTKKKQQEAMNKKLNQQWCTTAQPPKSTPIILITKHSWFNCSKWSETSDFRNENCKIITNYIHRIETKPMIQWDNGEFQQQRQQQQQQLL